MGIEDVSQLIHPQGGAARAGGVSEGDGFGVTAGFSYLVVRSRTSGIPQAQILKDQQWYVGLTLYET